MQLTGIMALVTLISHLFFISVAFWCVQNVHLERYLPMPAAPGKVLIVLLSIFLGFTCSNFFLTMISTLRNLTFLLR